MLVEGATVADVLVGGGLEDDVVLVETLAVLVGISVETVRVVLSLRVRKGPSNNDSVRTRRRSFARQ